MYMHSTPQYTNRKKIKLTHWTNAKEYNARETEEKLEERNTILHHLLSISRTLILF